jgi:hypothetical protein
MLAKLPPKLPMALRAAPTITMFSLTLDNPHVFIYRSLSVFNTSTKRLTALELHDELADRWCCFNKKCCGAQFLLLA